jgi:hypothetical protein
LFSDQGQVATVLGRNEAFFKLPAVLRREVSLWCPPSSAAPAAVGYVEPCLVPGVITTTDRQPWKFTREQAGPEASSRRSFRAFRT